MYHRTNVLCCKERFPQKKKNKQNFSLSFCGRTVVLVKHSGDSTFNPLIVPLADIFSDDTTNSISAHVVFFSYPDNRSIAILSHQLASIRMKLHNEETQK